MRFRLGVEDIEPGHWVAWVLDLPGCYSSGGTEREAIDGAPSSIAAHFQWRSQHGWPSPLAQEHVSVEMVERFCAFAVEDDRRAPSHDEVEEALWLLGRSRKDLLATVGRASHGVMGRLLHYNEWEQMAGLLDHVAWAEWWYLDRFNLAFPRAAMPAEPLGRLEMVRARTRLWLPKLVGDTHLVEASHEQWSARKLVRRALWHERDHTQQIARLLER